MNISPSFSPHNDVLNANPSTPSEKLSLIEELKRRGRVSVSTKRYPDAKSLYTKAIETLTTLVEKSEESESEKHKKDLAILYSNRSLCNLQMNQSSDSYDDATHATCNDPNYVKGFWRLGQACMAMKKTEEALIAYEKALGLDGESKAFKKECDKVKKQLEKERQDEIERKEKAEQEKEKEMEDSKNKKIAPPPKKIVSNANNNAKEEKKNDTTKTITTTTNDKGSSEFSKSDHVRGYKIVNGKKTSFFHHEQTEEEKRLIGDIAPKRIDPSQLPSASNNEPTKLDANATGTGMGSSKTSAWNKAGTWEEKDVSEWAIKSLKEKLMQCSYALPEGSPDPNATVQVTDVQKLISAKVAGGTAHASVATVRGKKRYIFEFIVCAHWEMTLGDGKKCKGQMTFLDIDGTHEMGEGYDISDYTVESDTPASAKYILERFVRDGGLRGSIEKAMDEWIELFRETY